MAGGAGHVLEKGLRTVGGQCPARVGKSVVENVNHVRRMWGGLPLGIDLSVKNIAGKLWPCGRRASVCVCVQCMAQRLWGGLPFGIDQC